MDKTNDKKVSHQGDLEGNRPSPSGEPTGSRYGTAECGDCNTCGKCDELEQAQEIQGFNDAVLAAAAIERDSFEKNLAIFI